MSAIEPAAVVHRPEDSCFEVVLGDERALCVYRRDGGVVSLTHTEVPVSHEGRGIAALLVRAALDWARREGLRVRPLCSYVAAYMRRHPETQDLL
ncbi:MAG: GNAT family N-acetyltransferase [Rubrivivax sp.]